MSKPNYFYQSNEKRGLANQFLNFLSTKTLIKTHFLCCSVVSHAQGNHPRIHISEHRICRSVSAALSLPMIFSKKPIDIYQYYYLSLLHHHLFSSSIYKTKSIPANYMVILSCHLKFDQAGLLLSSSISEDQLSVCQRSNFLLLCDVHNSMDTFPFLPFQILGFVSTSASDGC
jgi:hypothetical protein